MISFLSSDHDQLIILFILLVQAFAIFCGMAIHNTYIFEECVKANARRKIALDVSD